MKYKINKNLTFENDLWPEDKELFAYMEEHAVSEREKEFFEVQRYKQIYNFTSANDVVMGAMRNPDRIYIARVGCDEYIFGVWGSANEVHTMNLTQALNTNLKAAGVIDRDITLLDWLRERDYKDVEYETNFDDM